MGGLQPRWPLVLRSLQLPHAFYTSMYLEVVAVLHYNNHDGVIHARVLKSFKRILYTSDFQPVFRGKLVFRERSSGVPQEIWSHWEKLKVNKLLLCCLFYCVIIKFCLVFPKNFLLHKVVRDAKKVEKHCSILPESMYTSSSSFVYLCFFLFSAMHVKSLAFCVWEWRRYTQYNPFNPIQHGVRLHLQIVSCRG